MITQIPINVNTKTTHFPILNTQKFTDFSI